MATRADLTYEGLSPQDQESLGSLLQALVTLGNEVGATGSVALDEERLVRQRAPLAAFPEDSPARRLIDAFAKARLFTTGAHPVTGEATVTVAHESLLRVWPLAVGWAAQNRDFLRTRARIESRLKEGSPPLGR